MKMVNPRKVVNGLNAKPSLPGAGSPKGGPVGPRVGGHTSNVTSGSGSGGKAC